MPFLLKKLARLFRIFGPTVYVADKVSATIFNWVLRRKPKARPTIPAQPKIDTKIKT